MSVEPIVRRLSIPFVEEVRRAETGEILNSCLMNVSVILFLFIADYFSRFEF